MRKWLIYIALVSIAVSSVAETINCEAGYLHKKITDKAIKELKIVGTIDATDLQFIANELSQLETLDLGEADVVATETILNKGEIYNANEIPAGIFASMELKNVVFPQSLVTIGMGAFAGCVKLETIVFKENSALKKICDYAFSDCVSLKKVSMPNEIETIGKGAFAHCSSLTEIELNGVVAIGDEAFADCGSLSLVEVPEESNLAIVGEGAFINTSLEAFDFAKCGRLETIGMWSFANTKLTQVALPSSVKSVGTGAFFYNKELNSVSLPDGCDSIPAFAFAGANKVGNIEEILSENISEIGGYAFYAWDHLLAFVLSPNVKIIGERAFAKNTALTKIESKSETPPTLGEAVFEGVKTEEVSLLVPDKAPYLAAEQWRDFNVISPSGINDSNVAGEQIKAYFSGTMLMIEASQIIKNVQLVEVNGVRLCELSPNRSATQIEMMNYRSNLYIVKVTLESGKIETYKLTR